MRYVMKTKVLLTAILFTILAGMFETTEASYGNVHFSYFYENLRSHGRWLVLDDDFIVWQPYRMNTGWTPYYRGSWIWTDYGWYWDTDEPFGYIVYHYGRWYYDDYYGWLWVPDYEWAPAWVDWRYDDVYVGWAPLPPYAMFHRTRGIYFTVNININFAHWHFVKYRHFSSPFNENYYVGRDYKYRIYNHTHREDNGMYYDNGIRNRGVDRNIIERRGGKSFTQRNLTFGNTDDRRGGDRVVVRTADFENARNIDVREMNLEAGKNRTTLRTDKVEIGEKRSKLNEESTRRDVTPRGTVNATETRERGTTEVKREEARPNVQLENKREAERKTDLNRNTQSREPVLTKDPVRTKETESTSEPIRAKDNERVSTPTRQNQATDRNREVTPSRTSSRETGVTTRDNSRTTPTRETTRETQTRQTERESTGTKTKDRR